MKRKLEKEDVESKLIRREYVEGIMYELPHWTGYPKGDLLLNVYDADNFTEVIVLTQETTTFGRSTGCNHIDPHKSVGKFHAVIQFDKAGMGYLHVVDKSRITMLNHKMIEGNTGTFGRDNPLKEGDEFSFGESGRCYVVERKPAAWKKIKERLTFSLVCNLEEEHGDFLHGSACFCNNFPVERDITVRRFKNTHDAITEFKHSHESLSQFVPRAIPLCMVRKGVETFTALSARLTDIETWMNDREDLKWDGVVVSMLRGILDFLDHLYHDRGIAHGNLLHGVFMTAENTVVLQNMRRCDFLEGKKKDYKAMSRILTLVSNRIASAMPVEVVRFQKFIRSSYAEEKVEWFLNYPVGWAFSKKFQFYGKLLILLKYRRTHSSGSRLDPVLVKNVALKEWIAKLPVKGPLRDVYNYNPTGYNFVNSFIVFINNVFKHYNDYVPTGDHLMPNEIEKALKGTYPVMLFDLYEVLEGVAAGKSFVFPIYTIREFLKSEVYSSER